LGTFFESSLVKCNEKSTGFRHLDYFPLVNSRAHKLGDDQNQAGILNKQFRETYNTFLKTMLEKEKMSNADWLCYTFYLLLQDRIQEAIKIYERVNPDDFKQCHTLKIQYDYMTAYLDFYTGSETGFQKARTISKNYEDYPVLAWRILFNEILDQLSEFDGVSLLADFEIDQEDEEKKKANYKKSKQMEPSFSATLEGKTISLDYINIPKVEIKYYVIDPEVLFSRTPFVSQGTEDFSFTKPMVAFAYQLDKDLKIFNVPIEKEYETKNMVIEISAVGK